MFVHLPAAKENEVSGGMPHKFQRNPILPWIMPQQAQKVVGETVHHPGTSSGEGRSKKKEEQNKDYDQSEKAESRFRNRRLSSQAGSTTIASIHISFLLIWNRRLKKHTYIPRNEPASKPCKALSPRICLKQNAKAPDRHPNPETRLRREVSIKDRSRSDTGQETISLVMGDTFDSESETYFLKKMPTKVTAQDKAQFNCNVVPRSR